MAGQPNGIVHLRAVGFIGMAMDGETKLLTNRDRFVGATGVDDNTLIGHPQQRGSTSMSRRAELQVSKHTESLSMIVTKLNRD